MRGRSTIIPLQYTKNLPKIQREDELMLGFGQIPKLFGMLSVTFVAADCIRADFQPRLDDRDRLRRLLIFAMMKLTLSLTTLILLALTYCQSSSRGQGFTSSPDSLFFQCPVGKLAIEPLYIYSDAAFIELQMNAIFYGPDAKYFSMVEGGSFVFKSDTGYGQIHIRFACPANRVCKAVLRLLSAPTIDTVILHGQSDNLAVQDDESALRIYPNPASDYLAFNGDFKRDSVRIIDITGREMPVMLLADFIDLTSIPNGVYYLIDGQFRQRFIVQH
jgi:hypothetical protein